jgi:hypothetical protein
MAWEEFFGDGQAGQTDHKGPPSGWQRRGRSAQDGEKNSCEEIYRSPEATEEALTKSLAEPGKQPNHEPDERCGHAY